ncbi:MAG: antitoxin, partial [Chloroflexota bacterium]
MIPRYQVFRQRITDEWHNIRRAAEKAQHAFAASKRGGADETFYLDSTALNLHGLYNGVEQVFEWIAQE